MSDQASTSDGETPIKKKKPEPLVHDWDPTSFTSAGSCADTTTIRIKKELQEFYSKPPPGIFILARDEDITQLDALIIGPDDTPYQGGFFHFYLKFPADYPFNPPRVKLMTTGNGKVRFNPNFYSNGKVCLSILGTWEGPKWTAAQSVNSVLISIQSLMNDKPGQNEPGYEDKTGKEIQEYNTVVLHETLRVAVCDTLEGSNTTCPKQLIEEIVSNEFRIRYDYYAGKAKDNLPKDGNPFMDFLGGCHGTYGFASILQRMDQLIATCKAKPLSDSDHSGSILGQKSYSDVHSFCASHAGVPYAVAGSDGIATSNGDEPWDLNGLSDDEDDQDEEENSDLSDSDEV